MDVRAAIGGELPVRSLLFPASLFFSAMVGPAKQPLVRELYKTGLCKSWESAGACPYGVRCIFAHGHEQ